MRYNLDYVNEEYRNLYGDWDVTTEGDEEGKSVRDLGMYTGFVDEIALHLAPFCMYKLTFSRAVSVSDDLEPNAEEVTIAFDDIKLRDMNSEDRTKLMQELFKENNRPVSIDTAHIYGAFTIKRPYTMKERQNKLIKSALSKLTPDEIKALGF